MPPNQPPQGGYPQSGDSGYNPQGGQPGSGGSSPGGWSGADPTPQYGASPGAYQPTEQFGAAQPAYGQQPPAWGGQPASGYPAQGGGYGGPGGPGGYSAPPAKSSPLPWIIGGLVLLLVAGGIGLFFLLRDDDSTPIASTTTATTTTVATTDETTEDTTEETTEESTEETTEDGGPLPPPGSPAPTGSGDTNLDNLSVACEGGDMQACDDLLFGVTTGEGPTPGFESFYDYAYTCGDRLTIEEVAVRLCVDIYPDA